MAEVIKKLLKEKEIIYKQYVKNGYQDKTIREEWLSRQNNTRRMAIKTKQYVKNGYQDKTICEEWLSRQNNT